MTVQSQKETRPVSAIAMVGNVNVGKSTLFAKISTEETTSSRFPGTSVVLQRGHIKKAGKDIILTPGSGSIFSINEDEIVSRDILLPMAGIKVCDSILLVADAKNMKRSLALALQYMEYGLPMHMVINMTDEAASRGITIDTSKLSEILGIGITTAIAREGIGITALKAKLVDMRIPNQLLDYPAGIGNFLTRTTEILNDHEVPSKIIGLLLLADDEDIKHYVQKRFGEERLQQLLILAGHHRNASPATFALQTSNKINHAAEQLAHKIQQVEPPAKSSFLIRLGDWCTQLSTGIPIAFLVLAGIYFFVGSFGATFLVDSINSHLFEKFLIPWVTQIIEPIPFPFLRDMMVDPDFGILPTGVFLALGLVLPVLFCFYIAFGFLQDSGYLPRLSLLLDKTFSKMGLNGRGVIPLVMGFSCVTMALLTTRMLGTRKERNIATFLLLLGMPCAPLLAVMFVVLDRMPISASLTVFGIIFLQIFVGGFVLNKILPGARSPFIMEIPPLRMPKPLQVLRASASKTYFFIKEAIPVFILASLIVFLFERLGGLEILERALKPVITDFMGLPEKSVQVFIKTMIRRESGATELEHLRANYNNLQLVVNLLVMTFLAPCLNAVIVLFKERGTRTAMLILITVLFYALAVGTVVNHTCLLLGITFS